MADKEQDLEIDEEKADMVAGGVEKVRLTDDRPLLEGDAPKAP